MSTINQLPRADSVGTGDLFVIFSANNNDSRALPLSVLLTYLQTQLASTSMFETQYAAPNASGFSVTINPTTDGDSVYLLLTPLAGYAAGTIVLPELTECVDGQEVLVNSTQAVTALTVSGNGATVNGAPTTLAANGFFRLRFDDINNSWYRVG
jgi:hypothetical protein